MRRLLSLLLALLVASLVGVAIWALINRDQLQLQWSVYQVSAAPSYEAAVSEIKRIEILPDPARRLAVLTSRWGTGNRQLDLYLARYATDPQSSDAFREAFSLRFARDPSLLERWAHYWRHQNRLEPAEAVDSILSYVGTLSEAHAPRTITWRDVLDLQAAWTLAGHPELAERLTPTNYQSRYASYQAAGSPRPQDITRPESPLPADPAAP